MNNIRNFHQVEQIRFVAASLLLTGDRYGAESEKFGVTLMQLALNGMVQSRQRKTLSPLPAIERSHPDHP